MGIAISKQWLGNEPPIDLSTTGLQLRYLVRDVPITGWLDPPFEYLLTADHPALESLLDGIHDMSVEIEGPNIQDYRPVRAYLHLFRGRAVDPTVPIISQDNALGQDAGPGVVYVTATDRHWQGYPVDPSTVAWHTAPESTPDLYQEMMQPHTEQYQTAQMWWEEPPGTVSAGVKFVRGLQPKIAGLDFRDLYLAHPLGVDEPGWGGLRNLPFKDGPRGVGWTDAFIQGQCDSQGGFAFVSCGGPLRYMKPDGELITVAGWRVKPDHDPVWILKSYRSIRSNMELRGSWLNGQYADDPGFHNPMDVTIDPRDESVWYVAGFRDHVIWKVVVDQTTWIGTVSVFAGDVNHAPGYVDGTGTAARFNGPSSLVFDPVNDVIYVADQDNDAIRQITRAGVVSTLFGRPKMGERLQAAGAVSCVKEAFTDRIICSDQQENQARSNFEVTASDAASGVRPDIYAPFAIRVDSKGHIILLETSYASVRRINPATGEATQLAVTPADFTSNNRNWAWIDVDRWGNSGPKDGIFWTTGTGGQIDGNPGSVINEIIAWIPPDGGPQQFVFKNTGGQIVGWGENGLTHVPHYSWLVAVDPRGGLYMAGIGDHGITRARLARPTDFRFAGDWTTHHKYADVKSSVWRYGAAQGYIGFGSFPYDTVVYPTHSFAMKFGWIGHNYLGFADTWALTPGVTDAELVARFEIPPEIQTNTPVLFALTDFIRINGGLQPIHSGNVPPPPPPPGVTPSPDGTSVPPAPQIIDRAGSVWTIGAPNIILKNGTQASGGLGSEIFWHDGVIYVFGTDANWWQWTGAQWANIGPVKPGTVTPPPPPPPTDPCSTDPLNVTGVKWPASNTGRRSLTFDVGTKRWTTVTLDAGPPMTVTVIDDRGCTGTVRKTS